jgi:hypothetical protein
MLSTPNSPSNASKYLKCAKNLTVALLRLVVLCGGLAFVVVFPHADNSPFHAGNRETSIVQSADEALPWHTCMSQQHLLHMKCRTAATAVLYSKHATVVLSVQYV